MKKIAHFGAFDHDSYGDLIFPWMAEHFLGPEFELVHVAPTDLPTPWPDAKPIISVQDAINRDDWDGVLIGGGDIVQAGDWTPDKWRSDEILSVAALPSLWIGASLLAARLNIPLAWNAPGVPSHLSPELAQAARLALRSADYISVRDLNSRKILSEYSDSHIQVVPDSAVMVNDVWPELSEHDNVPAFVISMSSADLQTRPDDIADAIGQLTNDGSHQVSGTVLPLMPWQLEDHVFRKLVTSLSATVNVLPRSLTLRGCTGEIAQSRGYIGNSLHGFIAAVSFGVPAVLVVPSNSANSHKYAGFLRAIGCDPQSFLADSWREAVVLLRKCTPPKIKKNIENAERRHWKAIQGALGKPSASKNSILSELVSLVYTDAMQSAAFGLLPKALLSKSYMATKARNELARLYDDLNVEHHKVGAWAHSLEQQLSEATQLLSERQKEIAALSEETVKRGEWALGLDSQLKITHDELARIAAERDNHAASLAQLGKELEEARELYTRLDQEHHKVGTWAYSLDKQLAEATRLLSEREKEIAALSEETVKRGEWALGLDAQLKTVQAELTRVITERENQIALLNQSVVELKDQIAKLDRDVLTAEYNAKLQEQVHASELKQSAQRFDLERMQLLQAHSEKERALLKEHSDRERVLFEQLGAMRDERCNSEQEKTRFVQATSEKEHALAKEHAQYERALQDQIIAARQVAMHWESARNALRLELDAVKNSLAWRLTAPLRRLAGRNPSDNSDDAAHTRYSRVADLQTTHLTATANSINRQNTTSKYIEEVSMNDNSPASAYQGDVVIKSLDDLLGFHDEAFVRAAYRTLLGRAPEPEGMNYYVKRLRRGISKLRVIDQICRSKEAQLRAVTLPGFEEALRRDRWRNLPVVGAILRRQGIHQKLQSFENRLLQINDANGRRFDQIEKAITSLQQKVVQQVQTAAGAAVIQRLGYASVDSWKTAENLHSLHRQDFLEYLFQYTLGRHPEAHEVSHYLHLLDKGASKIHIIEKVFSCEESKNWLAKKDAVFEKTESEDILKPNTPEQPAAVTAESIRFTTHEKPLVSVIIPVYGKVEYTLRCLKSIQQNAPEVDFEIVVVDDKSPDNTVSELSKIQGIKLVVNTENSGFILSCNHGAEHAIGQYLCFLNNDTEVMPKWLDELVRTFHEFPGTGFVGSKLVYPNGSLQEAGGIIWQDGSAWNFGRNEDPSLPVYNYAREVDYCSGASIAVPKELFEQLGGFDEYYVPAYCEDSDLALKIRDQGFRVIYQPLSVVVHYEGITSGTDTNYGTKAYQIENSKKLFERWKGRLKNHQPNGTQVDNAKDRMAKRRVLVLDHCTPTPNQDAGSVTVYNLLLLLREMDFQITFIPEDNFLYMPEYTTALQRIGVEVLYAPFNTSVERHLKDYGQRYELVFLFRPVVMERHLKAVRKHSPKAKVLYHTVDLHYLRMMREAKLLNDSAKRKAAQEMKDRELNVIRMADASIVHSPAELDMLRPDLPAAKLHVFPLIMNVRGTEKQYRERSDIVFVGGYQHTPNVDAVQYFAKEVMPKLRQLVPGVRFYAVGSKPPKEIMDLASHDVIITGFVDDLNTFLDKIRIAVAPLRYGAGIKGKIGTTLAAGLPTVATHVAVEGMSLTAGKNILIADSPQDIAEAIAQLYRDENLWRQLQAKGIEFAESAWSAKSAWQNLQSILANIGIEITEHTHPLSLYEG